MNDERDRSRLQQTRNSIRSRVSRESLTGTGVPVDLTPVVEGARRRFGKVGLGFLAVVAVAALGVFMLRPSEEPLSVTGKPVAYLELTRGSVGLLSAGSLRDQDRRVTVNAGTAITAGSVIETDTNSGGAALRLANGGSIRLDADSRVRFTSASAVVLDRGAVYYDSSGRKGSEVEVRTTLGMVRDIGTQFEVRLLGDGDEEPSLRVRIREGRIVLRHGQESHTADEGEELILGDGGRVERGSIDVYGPEWNWVVDSAAIPEVEGQVVQTFLDWFAREGGWKISPADPTVEAAIQTDVMHGDLKDLNPHEAAQMILQESSRLEYRVEGEYLVITPIE